VGNSPFRTKDRGVEIINTAGLSGVMEDEERGWFWPPTGAEAELTSLLKHSEPVVLKEDVLKQAWLEEVVSHYPRVKPMLNLRNREYWQMLTETVKPSSTPGFPYVYLYPTNSGILKSPIALSEVVELAIARLERLGRMSPIYVREQLINDPLWAVRENLDDPTRFMVKKQPHPIRKMETQKWRGVNAASVVNQLMEKFLFHEQDNAEIHDWETYPSKPGVGLTDLDGLKLSAWVDSNGLNCSNDASGWDASLPEWLVMADAEMRIMLALDSPEWWRNAVRNVFLMSCHRLYMLNDGRVFRRKIPGSMASGRKVTAATNSRLRFLINVAYCQSQGCAGAGMFMGDDSVERLPLPLEEHQRAYADFAMRNFGVKLTDMEEARWDRFTFCGQSWEKACPIPCAPYRQVINVVQKPCLSTVVSLISNLRHHSALPYVLDYLASLPNVEPYIRELGLLPENEAEKCCGRAGEAR